MAAPGTTGPVLRGTPEYSQLLTALVSRQVIATLRTGRGYLPPEAVTYDTYSVGTNDTYIHGSVNDLPTGAPSGYVLSEGVTPTAEGVESDASSFQTTEYGRVITYSEPQARTNPHGFIGIVAEKVASAALDLVDAVAALIWEGADAAGAPGIAPGATPATANPIDTDSIIKAVTTLEMLGVPRLSNGTYGVLARPDVIATLQKEVGEKGWLDAAKFASPSDLVTGLMGVYRGCSFYSTPRIKAATGVVPSFVYGKEALAWADLSSLRVESVAPSASISDPLGQRGSAGFVCRAGGMLIQDHDGATGNSRYRLVVINSTPTVTVAT